MAATKKSASSSKPKKASPKSAKKSGDYRASYVQLRTLLDSLEYTALEYYTRGNSAAQRTSRKTEIYALLKPALNTLLSKIRDPHQPHTAPCPDGLNSCCGGCVPYRCPEFYDE